MARQDYQRLVLRSRYYPTRPKATCRAKQRPAPTVHVERFLSGLQSSSLILSRTSSAKVCRCASVRCAVASCLWVEGMEAGRGGTCFDGALGRATRRSLDPSWGFGGRAVSRRSLGRAVGWPKKHCHHRVGDGICNQRLCVCRWLGSSASCSCSSCSPAAVCGLSISTAAA